MSEQLVELIVQIQKPEVLDWSRECLKEPWVKETLLESCHSAPADWMVSDRVDDLDGWMAGCDRKILPTPGLGFSFRGFVRLNVFDSPRTPKNGSTI